MKPKRIRVAKENWANDPMSVEELAARLYNGNNTATAAM